LLPHGQSPGIQQRLLYFSTAFSHCLYQFWSDFTYEMFGQTKDRKAVWGGMEQGSVTL